MDLFFEVYESALNDISFENQKGLQVKLYKQYILDKIIETNLITQELEILFSNIKF